MQITDAETFALLKEIADDTSRGDDFRVRVDFKSHPAGMLSRLAIFQHVHFDQIAVAEPWLEAISDNAKGLFVLTVSHESNAAKSLGGVLTIPLQNGSKSEARFNWNSFDSEDYQGPRDVVYPSRANSQQPASTAPSVMLPKPKSESTAAVIEALAPFINAQKQTGPDPFARYMEMQAAERSRDESRRAEERERQEKREEREEQRAEQRRREDREREDKKEERERQYRLEIAAANAKSEERMMNLLTREPPKNALLEAMVQKSLASGDEQAAKAGALLGQMGLIMQQSMNMSLQMIHTQAELSAQNQPQSPVWDLAGKLVEGYFGMQGAQEDELADALEKTVEKKQLTEGDDVVPDETPEDAPSSNDEPSVENPLQRLDRAIRQEAPLRELADALCMAMVTPDFQGLYVKYKGNMQLLVTERYGDWVAAKEVTDEKERKGAAVRRVKYTSAMLPKAYNVARQRGIIRPPPAKKDVHAKAQPQAATKKKPALAAVKKEEIEPEPEKKEPA